MGEFGSIFCVAALNSFTKSIMFKPCGPSAWPMAGPGLATPAGQRRRMTALTPAIALRAARLRSARVRAARLRSAERCGRWLLVAKSVLEGARVQNCIAFDLCGLSAHANVAIPTSLPSRGLNCDAQ